MEEKKPHVFVNKIKKNLTNNETLFRSSNPELVKKEGVDVRAKIREIFNNRNYIYKADVTITTKEGQVNKRIVGYKDDYLLTIENEKILFNDIIDIEVS